MRLLFFYNGQASLNDVVNVELTSIDVAHPVHDDMAHCRRSSILVLGPVVVALSWPIQHRRSWSWSSIMVVLSVIHPRHRCHRNGLAIGPGPALTASYSSPVAVVCRRRCPSVQVTEKSNGPHTCQPGGGCSTSPAFCCRPSSSGL